VFRLLISYIETSSPPPPFSPPLPYPCSPPLPPPPPLYQVLNRLTYASALSHLRRCNAPLAKEVRCVTLASALLSFSPFLSLLLSCSVILSYFHSLSRDPPSPSPPFPLLFPLALTPSTFLPLPPSFSPHSPPRVPLSISQGKLAKPRMLHCTHWGMVCPAETPGTPLFHG
jgi:RNA polymerase Rpb2, domain 3